MLWQPLGLDHGITAYIGDVVLHGGAPYKDAWDIRPPGIFYISALAIFLFGKTGLALHLLDLILQTMAALAISRLGRRFYGPKAGMWAGILFAAAYFAGNTFWDLANGDIYAVLPMVLSLLCLLPERRGPRLAWDALAGLLIAVVFLVRYTHGLMFLPAMAIIFGYQIAERPYGWMRRILRLTALTAGFCASLAAFCLLLWHQGALGDFLATILEFAPKYATTLTDGSFTALISLTFQKHFRFFLTFAFLVIPAVCTLVDMRASNRKFANLVGVVWLVSAELGIVIMAKYWTYHWFPLYAPLSVLAGRTVAQTIKAYKTGKNRDRTRERIIAVCAIIFIFIGGIWTLRRYTQGAALATGIVPPQAYLKRFDRNTDNNCFLATGIYRGAQYLKEHTRPNDTVLMWGFDTLILYLADRRSPSRFCTNFPILAAWQDREWYDELVDSIRHKRPIYILVATRDERSNITQRTEDSLQILPKFPELHDIVLLDYFLETTIGNIQYYRRH